MTTAVRRRLLVSGRVQGVFYRDSCRRRADGEGLSGWVRNLADGRVEVCLEGQPDAVERMIEWCRHGPRHADVAAMEVLEERPVGERGFSIR